MSERLQKVLARAGVGSRRHCESLIRAGRVQVDGAIASLGDSVDVTQVQITVDGTPLDKPASYRYLKLYKPKGYLCSQRSQGGHPTIFDLVNLDQPLHIVGRLDLDSKGLVLLTNHGDLTLQLTHPRYEHEKEYLVTFSSCPTENQLNRWRQGVELPDGFKTGSAVIEIVERKQRSTVCRVILKQGHKRQIRSTASVLGLTVLDLIRTRIATVRLGSLEVGNWQECTHQEIKGLLKLLTK
jgi:pseudouridine synthase